MAIVAEGPAQLRYSERVLTAGEAGDGPDQGYSGGADSVPPAPNLQTKKRKLAMRLAKQASAVFR